MTSHFTPQQLQKDAMKLVEFAVASTTITAQILVISLATFIYW